MSQFNGNLSPAALTQYLLIVTDNASFLFAFIALTLFQTPGNQWRQLGRVYGWLSILQMSHLDKQHTQGQTANGRQGYLVSRSPKSWSWPLYHHSTLPMGAETRTAGRVKRTWVPACEVTSGICESSNEVMALIKNESGSQEAPQNSWR